MSNEPIFQKLAREYAMRGTSYERTTTPYLSPVRPLGAAKQPLMETPVYGPNEHLDGPHKAPLPKRNLARLIQLPEPNPEVTKRFQDFITTAPLAVLQTPRPDLAATQLALYKGTDAGRVMILDEAVRYQETGELDPVPEGGYTGIVADYKPENVPSLEEVVTVRGTLISEEDDTSNPTITKQTDESVNAASNEENDEDDEPVILAPNFWKIRDEE